MDRAQKKFFTSMTDTFLGEAGRNIEGESGYTNLMNIKNKYFEKALSLLNQKIESKFDEDSRDEVYNKLYTFFNGYLNETGTPFFNNTQIHRNIHDKIYTNSEDVALFWKTKKLFYVKSEVLYTSMKIEKDNVIFNFDASKLQHQSNNEKKELEFILTDVIRNEDKTILNIKVKYKESNSYKLLGEICRTNKKKSIIDFIVDRINKKEMFNESSINFYPNNINIEYCNLDNIINIYSSKTCAPEGIDIELGINMSNNTNIIKYLKNFDINLNSDYISKVLTTYKKQNEINYFIHKDATNFLKEQFNIYLYNYIFNGDKNEWTVDRIRYINNIKEIAYDIIGYIGALENEIKNIWIKPKFVRKSNYVLTIDKLNVRLIKKIIKHQGFDLQIEEWHDLYKENDKKKVWNEFSFILSLNKDEIIILDNNNNEILNPKFRKLTIDTKYFKDIELEILSDIGDIDNNLDGVIIKSDNFQALNTLSNKYNEKVHLVYIDPPFKTGKDFEYKDGYEDGTWLTIMENRLELTKTLMHKKASIYVHLDHNADYLGRLILNDKFGKKADENFKAECIWSYSWGSRNEDCWNRKHDTILMYSKNKEVIFNAEEVLQDRKLQKQSKDRMKYKGAMIVDKNKRKSEKALPTAIFDIPTINGMALEKLPFDTQKPEELLNRIILASSNKGHRVMDYFSGTGTTIATAHKLGRKWIGVEQGEHFYSIIIPRMKKVLSGDNSGISKEIEWTGGGFFKYYELEQYEDTLRNSKYVDCEGESLKADIFYNSEKLLDVMKIDDDKACIDFRELYKDVDIPETISNMIGKNIKSIESNFIVFEDGTKFNTEKIEWSENKFLKPLFWWGN